MIEARCSGCGETFNPNDAGDLTHAEKGGGDECGALGVVSGSWTAEESYVDYAAEESYAEYLAERAR